MVWNYEVGVLCECVGDLDLLSCEVDARGGSEEVGRSGRMWHVEEILSLDLMCVLLDCVNFGVIFSQMTVACYVTDMCGRFILPDVVLQERCEFVVRWVELWMYRGSSGSSNSISEGGMEWWLSFNRRV